jgi:hypothetical protein
VFPTSLVVPAVVAVPAVIGFLAVVASLRLLASLLLLVYLQLLVILLLLSPYSYFSFLNKFDVLDYGTSTIGQVIFLLSDYRIIDYRKISKLFLFCIVHYSHS